jgi:hypothetical protein
VRSARNLPIAATYFESVWAETIRPTDCSNDMSEEQKLRRNLARHRAVLRLVSDRRAAVALREVIEQTRARLKHIKLRTNSQTEKLDQ